MKLNPILIGNIMEQVDPLYLTTPLWQLVNEFGYEWLKEQDEIFKRITEEDDELC